MSDLEQAAIYGVAVVTLLGTLVVFIVQWVRNRDDRDDRDDRD